MDQYDYIVVGGGSAGCVVASRLVNDFNARVLLLEAGQDDDHHLVRMPAGSFKMIFGGGEFVKFHETDAQPHLSGRTVSLPQGNVLGGGSSVNVMAYTRGSRHDYARWDAVSGNTGWGWDDLLAHFLRQEGNQRFDNDFHNGDGPLKVSEQPYIVEGAHLFVRTMQRLGVPFTPDFNTGNLHGVGYHQATLHKGERCNAARAFLDPIRKNPRLTIATHARVNRVIVQNGRATGVEYRDRSGTKRARAERETVLTAGALVTPKLLMLSGIGPAKDLADLGIDVVSDQPGVGRNLQDHHSAFLIAGTKGAHGYHGQSSGLAMVRNALQYMLFKSGPVASTGSESMAFLNLDDANADPDFQLYAIQTMWPGIADAPLDHGITFMANLMKPKSKGSVRLRSADPDASPIVDMNWLSEPEDQRRFVKGLRLLRHIIRTEPIASIIKAELAPGPAVETDAEILDYIKRTTGSNYHPCGTVRMGAADDREAVLTPDLRVKGVEGLRVMDASMMPNIISCNTNATVMAVADRGVDLMMRATSERAPQRSSDDRPETAATSAAIDPLAALRRSSSAAATTTNDVRNTSKENSIMSEFEGAKSVPAGFVSLDAAKALIEATLEAVKKAGFEAAVAIADATGSLRAFERTDGTPFLAAEVAIGKAWTAASYGYPTHVWNQYVQDPTVTPLAHHPKMMAVGGGFPILDGGKLVGGIGVSGGSAAQDQSVCEVALKKLGFEIAG